ncbi:PepSY-associated TM helix domain-containing protein [Alkaliflexus imshenetskii]|uniref:PepSY-associated TM helix domain-containing protein n=1 Tax=Alkaliflexus imshenetskii TaxID=286730 RepID=UPI00047DA19D|nr:PepSY-associated TM helix domain-containing protein [Alkaliflexus imshenetskii]
MTINIREFRNIVWRLFRQTFKKLHLWLGVASALVLTVVSLSGTIYVFNSEVVELLNRDKYVLQPSNGTQPLSHEVLISRVEESVSGQVAFITVPDDYSRSWSLMVRQEGQRRGTFYLVNQYSGELTPQSELRGQAFFSWMLRLHRWLLLDSSVGRPIVGWATIIMLFLILSGLVIWLPRNVKYWYKGFKLKFSGSAKRLNYDLHRGFGFYAAIFILIMALTGPFWSFEWYRKGFYDVLGVEMPQRGPRPQQQAPAVQAEPSSQNASTEQLGNRHDERSGQQQVASVGDDSGSHNRRSRRQSQAEAADSLTEVAVVPTSRMSLATYLTAAQRALPYKGVSRVTVPAIDAEQISVSRSRKGFFAYSGTDRVEMNLSNAEVTVLDKFTDKPVKEQIAGSVKAIHTGEIFGLFTKILYFFAALIASILPITGVILWINRLRGKARGVMLN